MITMETTTTVKRTLYQSHGGETYLTEPGNMTIGRNERAQIKAIRALLDRDVAVVTLRKSSSLIVSYAYSAEALVQLGLAK